MAIGNLLIGAQIQQTGSIGDAATHLTTMLGIDATVLPVSVENIHLSATLADGSRVHGELEVRRPDKPAIAELSIDGESEGAWLPVRRAIAEASYLILGPGSLWTSIGGVLSVSGVREAIGGSSARVVFICNTTTQPGQSDGLDFVGHVEVIARLLGRVPHLVLANSGALPEPTEEALRTDGLILIRPSRADIAAVEARGSHVIAEPVLAPQTAAKPQLWEKLHTAYHDTGAVSQILGRLMLQKAPPLAGGAATEGRRRAL